MIEQKVPPNKILRYCPDMSQVGSLPYFQTENDFIYLFIKLFLSLSVLAARESIV